VQIDVIDIFRNPAHLPGVLADAQAMAHQAKYFWMQPGAENPEVAEQAAASGYVPVMNACALAELRSLAL
jgi:predicted CoA-binding protein